MSEDNNTVDENEEEKKELMRQLEASTTQQVAELLVMMAPHLDDELIYDLASKTAHEQVYTIPREVLPTLFSPEAREEYPTFFVVVQQAADKGKKTKKHPVAMVRAAKDLSKVSESGPALTSVSILALVLTPASRALLRAYGYHIEFGQSKEEPQTLITL